MTSNRNPAAAWTEGIGTEFARLSGEVRHRRRRRADGFGLEAAGLVEAASEAGLPSALEGRGHAAAGDFGHEEFDRVGADINDSARAHGGKREGGQGYTAR
jgi:hypothetical protein